MEALSADLLTAEAWAYLSQHRIGHLATVDEAARPVVIPICFAVDGQAIYSALDEKPKRVAPQDLRRVRNIVAHPDVALVVDDYSEDWTRLSYLLVRGHAQLLDPLTPDHAVAVDLLRAKYVQYQTMAIHEQAIIRIRPVHRTFWTAAPNL